MSAPSIRDAGAEKADVMRVLTFDVGRETFAAPVDHVREIIDIIPVTAVPNAGAAAPGLINVRGEVTPVIDLHHRFGLTATERTSARRTIVFDADLDGEKGRVAVEADRVREVAALQAMAVEDIPDIGSRWDRRFVAGVTQVRGAVVVILNLQAVFDPNADRL